MNNDAPTLEEIFQLTRQELTAASKTDSIRECGRAALSLLPTDHDTALKLAYQKLHDVPYKDVKTCWRRLYTDASLWKVVELVQERDTTGSPKYEQIDQRDWLDEVVRLLDMALILVGSPQRKELVELWFAALKALLPHWDAPDVEYDVEGLKRPLKRRRIAVQPRVAWPRMRFPNVKASSSPTLQHPLLRLHNLSQSAFQAKISEVTTHTPTIIEGAIEHWPALDERPWSRPGYLLEQTLGGRRLVPVEVGKSYTDEGWGQKIVSFREFMDAYMLAPLSVDEIGGQERQPGYLAQHDLFAQIPTLRADISIPDYCYCDPAPSPYLTHIKSAAKLEEPLLNAWFGPAGTVSPLHTDPYHNILAQVLGSKYVRLYAPEETPKLYSRSVDENGVDMSNTSQIDLEEAMKVWPEISCWTQHTHWDKNGLEDQRKEFEQLYPDFKNASYVEGILGPGECLYIPAGWWHYVRSLSPSFSVSFWFN
ncbi:Clavaminate synthase-like protein [Setomelanomma holmii]|uniref:Clavaminate synthase-like protein n=1 Tax=Setomelanomma holmii TaxID=210430 RepID=A0A9P4LU73_9PLEO|nr:Clavaminate synthase-like protein [Setomelanomma holmii]